MIKDFRLKRVENISSKPILSVGNYVSLDAECIIAGSSDRNLRFFDIDTLDEFARCQVDKKSVSFVAISQMGIEGEDPIVVTGGKDSTVQMWNLFVEGNLERNIELPTTEVRCLSIYQGSSTYLVVGTKDSFVIVWDILEDVLLAKFAGHKASVHCVSITSAISEPENGNDLESLCIASGGADRTVRTWCLKTSGKLRKFRHKRSVSSIVVSYGGIRPILCTSGVERIIKLWDVESAVLLRNIPGHLDQINSMTIWEGFQTLLISASSDQTLRVFDIITGECVCILCGHTDSVLSVTISDLESPKIISCSEDLSIIQWDLKQIIDEFYLPEQGERNDEPAYLPEIFYEAPEELDKTQLSKEERKRIRKQIKKEKRKKQLELILSPVKSSSENVYYSSDVAVLKEPQNDLDIEPKADDLKAPSPVESVTRNTSQMSLSRNASRKVIPSEAVEDLVIVKSGSISNLINRIKSTVVGTDIQNDKLDASNKEKVIRVVADAAVSITVTAGLEMVSKRITASLMKKNSLETPNRAVQIAPQTGTGSFLSLKAKSQEQSARAHAIAAQNKFTTALVEQALEVDRQKARASEKLAARLNKKKQVDGSYITSESAKDNDTLNILKHEKLKQHKMQESRRRQSMLFAKERSNVALQKRLEERKAVMTSLGEDKSEENSDSDSDAGVSAKASGYQND